MYKPIVKVILFEISSIFIIILSYFFKFIFIFFNLYLIKKRVFFFY